MRFLHISVWCVVQSSVSCFGQAFNIDFAGGLTEPPSSGYAAAAGQPGYWNDGYNGLLRGLDGQTTSARIDGSVGGGWTQQDIPGATGGDEALMETVTIRPKNGNQLVLLDIEPGFYDLYLYMWGGHFQGEDRNGFGVFNGVDTLTGGVDFDGVWPGGHVEGVTYRSVRIEILPQFGGFIVNYGSRDADNAYVNGLQLVPVPAPSTLFFAPLAGLIACRRRRRDQA